MLGGKEKERREPITKLHCPSNLFIDVLTMIEIKIIQTQKKHVHHFRKYSKDIILFQNSKNAAKPSQTIQINNHSSIENRDTRSARQQFSHAIMTVGAKSNVGPDRS